MKKLLVFGEALTFPPKEGITAHVFALLESLVGSSIESVLLLCDRGFIAPETIQAFPWKTIVVPPNVFYDYHAVERILQREKPDILQAYNVYQARLIAGPYSLRHRVPLVMEHHDLEASLANFLELPPAIAEANSRSQLEISEIASLNRVMSDEDCKVLQNRAILSHKTSFMHIPVGIPDLFDDGVQPRATRRDVIFVGNCAYPPNRQAAEYVSTQLAHEVPEFTFHLVGRLTEELTVRAPANVHGYGMVDDLRPLLARAFCGIIPISAGSGMKIKSLTYLTAGLPVVGTSKAFEGVEHAACMLACELDSFAPALRSLANNPHYELLSQKAREVFTTYYDAASIARLLERLYNSLAFRPTKAAYELPLIQRDDSRLAWIHEIRENRYPILKQPRIFEPTRTYA